MSALEQEPCRADELIALFTGVEHEEGGWITSPCYTVPLAEAIAGELEPASEIALRKALYGERIADDIDELALRMIGLGYAHWRSKRERARAAARTRSSL